MSQRIFVLPLFLACAALANAATAPTLPTWLEPFPGVNPQTAASGQTTNSSYDTEAPVTEVTAHYRKLFEAAGLPFEPQMIGTTALIRASAPTYNLLIQVRSHGGRSAVQITYNQHAAIPHLTEKDITRSMAEYDQPVYPRAHAPMPALVWPSWLVQYEGRPAHIEKGVDQFHSDYLTITFTSKDTRAAIEQYYSELLTSHGYPIFMESSPLTPPTEPTIVEGVHYFDKPGPRFVIHAELTNIDAAVRVELRISAHRY